MRKIMTITRKLSVSKPLTELLLTRNSHCTLNTHGHLDQKRVTVESIGSFVDKDSSEKPLGDENV